MYNGSPDDEAAALAEFDAARRAMRRCVGGIVDASHALNQKVCPLCLRQLTRVYPTGPVLMRCSEHGDWVEDFERGTGRRVWRRP